MVTSIAIPDFGGVSRTVQTLDALTTLVGEVQSSPTTNTVLDRLKVIHTDLSGTAAGNLLKAEDAAHTSGDAGVMALSVRSDAGATTAGTDADYAALITDASGRLWVNIGASASSIAKAEDAAHTTGDVGAFVLTKRTDTAASSAGTDGDYATLNTDNTGRMWTRTGADDTLYTEDAAAAADPVGPVILAVRRDTLSTSEVSADGDNIAVKATSKGELHSRNLALETLVGEVQASPTSNTMLDRLKTIGVQLTAGAAAIAKLEDAASVNGDAGVPAMAIQLAAPTNTAGTDADYAMLQMSDGRLWVSGDINIVQAASSTITRPTDTTPYASGDLVANSVTAGSVVNLQFTTLARVSGGGGEITGVTLQKSTTSTSNAAFRVHLFDTAPTYTSAGDNSPISTVVVASGKGYLGYVDVTAMVAFSDVAWGTGAPDNTRQSLSYKATAQIIYALVEARGAYTPGNAEVFTVRLAARQN